MRRALAAFLLVVANVALRATLTAALPTSAGPVTDAADVLTDKARGEALAIIRDTEQKRPRRSRLRPVRY